MAIKLNKNWERKAKTPGTIEFVQQRNRESEIEAIRLAQYQSDLQKYISVKMGKSTDVQKKRKLAKEFREKYATYYKVTKFSPKKLSDIKDNITRINEETIGTVSGSEIALFKDKVFTNVEGKVFTLGNLGQSVHGTVQGITGNISLGKNVTTTAGHVLANVGADRIGGVIKSSSVGSVISNVNTINNTYTHITAGRITGVTQVNSIIQSFASGATTKIASIGKVIGSSIRGAFSKFF